MHIDKHLDFDPDDKRHPFVIEGCEDKVRSILRLQGLGHLIDSNTDRGNADVTIDTVLWIITTSHADPAHVGRWAFDHHAYEEALK